MPPNDADAAPMVFLVDDEEDVTRGLAWLLDSIGVKSQAYHSARAFIDAYEAQPQRAACLVTDLRMPDMNGLELVETLHARGHRLPVVFLTAHGDVPIAVRAMQLGAVDFVQKPFNPDVFLGSMNKALRLAREAESQRLQRSGTEERLRLLSAREREIFEHLLDGLTSKEIGRALSISFRTVDVHRANIMHKLDVAHYGELLRRFAERGEARHSARG